MKRFEIFFITGFVLLFLGIVCLAQESRSDRGDRGERSNRPPWMQGAMGGGQPPWMQGGMGGPMGGGPPPWMQGGMGGPMGGSDSDRNERFLGMLRSMDTNGNGKLEQSEIPEYRRGFVSMIVTRMGGDPNKTIDLAELTRKAANSSNSSTQNASPSSRSNPTSQTTDPLVPYFGEKETVTTPVLAFGQREVQAKTTGGAVSGSALSLSQSDQLLRSARNTMNKYDKNKNGTLDKDKGEWVSSLPFDAAAADKNHDGRISMTELLDILGGKAGVTTGSAVVSTKQSSAYDRLPPGMPDWFFERDKDQDGQLTMLEYAHEQIWTEAIADEFRFLDKNNDGVATVTEIFETLKQVDEEKRLKEEQAKRDIERRKGAGTIVVTPPTSAPTDTTAATPVPPQPSPQPPVPPGTTSSPPTVPSTPVEPAPNWRPTSTNAVPATPPSTAPYSTGSSDSDRRQRYRDYQRSSSRYRER